MAVLYREMANQPDRYAKLGRFVIARQTILHLRLVSCSIAWFRGFFVGPRAGVDEEAGEREADELRPAQGEGHAATSFLSAGWPGRATAL